MFLYTSCLSSDPYQVAFFKVSYNIYQTCIAFSMWLLFMPFHFFCSVLLIGHTWLVPWNQNKVLNSLHAVSHDFLANQPDEEDGVCCFPLSRACCFITKSGWSGPSLSSSPLKWRCFLHFPLYSATHSIIVSFSNSRNFYDISSYVRFFLQCLSRPWGGERQRLACSKLLYYIEWSMYKTAMAKDFCTRGRKYVNSQ